MSGVFILLVLNGSSLIFLDDSGFAERGRKNPKHTSISNYFIEYQIISYGGTL
jgi:hypothetical protein